MKKNISWVDRVIILMCAVAMIALSITACAGSATPVNATLEPSPLNETRPTEPAVDYEAEYHNAVAEMEACQRDYQSQLDDLTLKLEQALEDASDLQEECDLVKTERDQALADCEEAQILMDDLIERCSTQYVVIFEVRRKVLFPSSEESLRISVSMTEEEFSQYREGSEVSQALPCLSIPSDSFNVDWSVVVADTYIAAVNVLD